MITAILLIVILNTFLIVVLLLSKWWIRQEFRDWLAAAQADWEHRHEQIWTLLEIIRDLATSARDNRKETAIAVVRVADQLTEEPSRRDLAKKLEQVPDRTADKVVEKLPESSKDWRGREHEKTP